MNEPRSIQAEIAETMARIAPKFTECEDCHGLTTGRRCFDCERKRDRARDAREKTSDALPEGFRWAVFGSALLLERTGGDHALLERARSAVGATRVLLVGPSGSGKTSLAVAMLRCWAEHNGEQAMFVLATDLASARSRSRFGAESTEVSAALAAPLLVIDDLGTDKDIPTSAVTEVVFHRHAHSKPTWVTTWTTHEQRVTRYGDGLARRVILGVRIIECGKGAQ